MFEEPLVNFGVLSATLFTSADAPNLLHLGKLEALAKHSPIIVVLISGEEKPERITLLKNLRCFVGSLSSPSPLDSLVFRIHGSQCQKPSHGPPDTLECLQQ